MNLPSAFIERMREQLGNDCDRFFTSLDADTPTSIRLNRRKTEGEITSDSSSVKWCDTGYYLAKRPSFTFDPCIHQGCYYVQEASSMFVEQAIKQYVKDDIHFLDLCAAPGGKSTLVASLLSDDSLLVCNEVIRSRAYILSENIAKWGASNTIVTNSDPEKIGELNDLFDAILVDAPCSGEGMFRKDVNAIEEWSEANIELCRQRQQRILANVWSALKPNGLLLYSTCTYNVEENENNVQWICDELGAEVLPIDIKLEWGVTPSQIEGVYAYRFYPHKTKGEGFFFALLRKHDGNIRSRRTGKNKEKERTKEVLSDEYRNYLKIPGRFRFYSDKDIYTAFLTKHADALVLIKSKLKIVSYGVCLGEMKGKTFIPDQSLALSNELNIDAFPTYEVTWREAISYLRKEMLVLPLDEPKGYILLTYRSKPLGFVKNLGNRTNNLYPQEWRIRSSAVPNEEVKL